MTTRLRVWKNGGRVGLEVFTGRAWWRFWMPSRLVIWMDKGEAVTLRNLLGGVLGSRV